METPDPEIFGPLAAIAPESLVLLASNIAKRCLDLPPNTSGKLVGRTYGSFNIVHIIELGDVKLVIRVPAWGWGSRLTQTAVDAMESHVATVRLIRSKTTIPVPEIYAIDTSANNEIGAPYLCMSFLPGKQASGLWFNYSGTLTLDEFRLNLLTSLARAMAQLSCFSFDQLGSIMKSGPDSVVIGPNYGWEDNEDGSMQATASGPYDSTSALLRDNPIGGYGENEHIWTRATNKTLEVLLDCLPIHDSPSSFVLCHPDLNYQNILVDDQGTVTGLIDWDRVQTQPRFMGYIIYPSWITRDWDPLWYAWPTLSDREDSPETLERYRAHYTSELGKALEWKGDWKYSSKAHLFEAIWIATFADHCSADICEKFVHTVVGDDTDASDIFFDIGGGYIEEEDWAAVKAKLRRFVCGDQIMQDDRHRIDNHYKRSAYWDNTGFDGNGSRLRGLKENIMQTLISRHQISLSTATIFSSELLWQSEWISMRSALLPSNMARPSGTGSQTPTGSFTGPLPKSESVVINHEFAIHCMPSHKVRPALN
ncbi:kinase-like domain-containing protein [Nemania sp. FL0916]|nr:kinase-like domain-containing protein [Nemania sp. FL0916]